MEKRMQGIRRVLGIAVFWLIFTASAAGAAPLTGTMDGFWKVTAYPDAAGNFSHFTTISTTKGAAPVWGALTCQALTTSLTFVEPTGACLEGEYESVATVDYTCQFEGDVGSIYGTETARNCAAASCLDDQNVTQVGCTWTYSGTVTMTGGSGVFQDGSGGWTSAGSGEYTAVQPNAFSLTDAEGTWQAAWDGEIMIPDEEHPPAGVALGIPSPGANVSGISLISGWSCLGGELAVEFSDADGVIETMTVVHGTERLDTESTCGDIKNGFSATYNWSRLGSGEKTARLIRNGEEVGEAHTFFVTAFDTEFVTGAEGMCTIADFPDAGKNATFVWEQSQQGLVLESVN